MIRYISGYLDGDGCFYLGKTIQKHKNIVVYEYSIQIVSVKRKVLDTFCKHFGGHVGIKPDKVNHKRAYVWTAKCDTAKKLALKVFPHVIDKKLQCKYFIELCNSINCNNFKVVSNNNLIDRDQIIEKSRRNKEMEGLITKEDIERINQNKLTVIPTDFDFPYLAGLIDSEGCFRIKKWKPINKPNHVYNITVEIGNTKFPILPWLLERFGGSVCFIPAKENKRASATWTLSAAALYAILPRICVYLCNKKAVCEKLIEFQGTILPNGGDRHSELFRALFEKNREVRERIVQEVHMLNKKGS